MSDTPSKVLQDIVPPQVASDARCVILVGGTFDPVHLAHVKIPVEAREALKDAEWRKSWLVFVPAAVSPFKIGQASGASAEQRVAMTRLAIRDVERACVWSDEIDRSGGAAASYTIDTVRRLMKARPDLRPRILIGADQAASLHKWRECHKLVRLAPPVCVLRAPLHSIEALKGAIVASGAWSSEELRLIADGAVTTSILPYSSTAIRTAIAMGTPATAVEGLDPQVARLIETQGLYRSA